MRKFLWSVLKWLILAIIVGVSVGGVFYIANHYGWPWWVGAALVSAVFGMIAIAILLRRLHFRYREKKFVERIVNSDQRTINSARNARKQQYLKLKQRWLDAVSMLKKSRLKTQGNPLYVLPWYMIFGETDSGKTSAVFNCGLTSVLSKVGPVEGVSSTKNCDWWFFEEAVVMDTAGRYAAPLNEHDDETEWIDFLSLLVKYRKHEPVNGIVITLPADKLLRCDEHELRAYGCYIGSRLNNLVQVMGARVPIYLMITKIDQIYGFADYISDLSQDQKQKALGTNVNTLKSPSEFVDTALSDIFEQLIQYQLSCTEYICSGRIAFTSELLNLRDPIQLFINGAFDHDSYHESAMLRGLYLSSATQSGTVTSKYLGDMAQQKHSGKTEGVFLNDLFARVLPGDRNAFEPIRSFLSWKTLQSNTAFFGIFMLCFSIAGFLTFNYMESKRHIALLKHQVALVGNDFYSLEQELLSLQAIMQSIKKVRSEHFFSYSFNLPLDKPVNQALMRAERLFVKRFEEGVLELVNKRQVERAANLVGRSSLIATGDTVDNLASQLAQIRVLLAEESGVFRGRKEKLQLLYQGVNLAYQEAFEGLFTDYVGLQNNRQQLRYLDQLTQSYLSDTLALHHDFSWITAWASNKVPAVRAETFWNLPLMKTSKTEVSGAYTQEGYKLINRLLAHVSLMDRSDLHSQINRFKKWYAVRYVDQWRKFNNDFVSSGRDLSISNRRLIIASISGKDNPFIKLQNRALREISAIQNITDIKLNSLILSKAIIDGYWAKQDGGGGELAQKSEFFLSSMLTDHQLIDTKYFETVSEGEKLYNQLIANLEGVASSLDTEEEARITLAGLFEFQDKDSGLISARSNVDKLSSLLSLTKEPLFSDGSQIFKNMYQFIIDAGLDLTSCNLQNHWESDVLGAIKYVPDSQKNSRIFSQEGLLDNFLNGPAKGFVSMRSDGWRINITRGVSVPFKGRFFDFIERGSYIEAESREEYQVNMTALPVDVNSSALKKPYLSLLTLHCAEQQQKLVNYNYPVSSTFIWNPKNCGTTSIMIKFEDFELTYSWSGPNGFQQFLQAFYTGYVDYNVTDFPEYSQLMEMYGLKWLRIKFHIDGLEPILNLAEAVKLPFPKRIAECRIIL